MPGQTGASDAKQAIVTASQHRIAPGSGGQFAWHSSLLVHDDGQPAPTHA
jgi:hypothetical protein